VFRYKHKGNQYNGLNAFYLDNTGKDTHKTKIKQHDHKTKIKQHDHKSDISI